MSLSCGHATPIEILLVEDSPSDIDLTREAPEDTRVHNRLSVVTDGVEALAFLRKEGEYADQPHPEAGQPLDDAIQSAAPEGRVMHALVHDREETDHEQP